MPLVDRHCRAVASALLALAALGATSGVSLAQGAMGPAAVELERRSVEVERLHAEQRRSAARSQAHARMPDTMYASTPDPAPPPHAVPIEVKRPGAPERSAADGPARPPGEESPGHRLPLFVSASGASGYEGVVRLINRSDGAGEVRIEGYDDAGVRHGPVTLRLEAGEAVHLSAEELERGSGAKGLTGRLGSGEGEWRLELVSALDLEVLGYVRSADGFLGAMHDGVPRGEAGHRVVLFNAGSNAAQASRLRIVNPGAQAAAVRIEGIDDAGEASAGALTLTVGAGAARTLGAAALESGEGEGLTGALGTGTGRWRLLVSADTDIEVLSLIASASGLLANVSTVPSAVGADAGGASTEHLVPLLPAAARWAQGGVRGWVRIVNRSGDAGEVRIEAFDDAGVQAPAVAVAVGATEAVELTSEDVESGSADAGLSGGIGTGEGDWWLRLNTSLDVEVLAYVQSQDGFVSPLHDAVPRVSGTHRVGTFNPASETTQASRLRIVNPGTQAAQVRIEGIDDAGEPSPGALTLTVGAGAARTLDARALESGDGEGVSGGLGDGTGRWRLLVSADTDIAVMSLLSGPGGHLANLSTAPGAAPSPTAEEVFAQRISAPIVQGRCVACHTAGAVAGTTRLLFEPASSPEHQALNLQAFEDLVDDDGAEYILNKMQGVGHGGGVQVAAGTPEFADMERFLALLGEEELTAVALTPQTLFDTVTMAPTRKTLRRAALIFAGRIPTDEEYAAALHGPAALRATIRGMMTGPEFHEFLIRGANDRLLTERAGHIINNYDGYVDFVNESDRRKRAAFYESGKVRDIGDYWDWVGVVQHGARRAPLELIAHVVENDLPYTEVLTADYIMANPWAARAYGDSTRHFVDPGDMQEFRPSRIVKYYRKGEGLEREFDRAIDSTRILDPGPLITNYPHAGILNTTSFLLRYPTTATNRNRARSRWTYYHFLGLDVEKSASRTTDADALADTNNPTLVNPACTACHRILDPVAGAFQNYADNGYYRDSWGGADSLDDLYKRGERAALPVRAGSWQERETLSWPVALVSGTNTLKVFFPNDFWHEESRTTGTVFLDRLRLADGNGRVVTSLEFEDVPPPPPPREGECGRAQHNSATGRVDHYRYGWGGEHRCALFVDVEAPAEGGYVVEVVAWADRYDHRLHYAGDAYSEISVEVGGYRTGDTWYRDMRAPGFNGEPAQNADSSVQWLARQIVADERFAEAAVKFWWPAIMGSEIAEPPEDEGDAGFEGRLLAANAQGAEVDRLARGFRRGFQGQPPYNLKDLLVEMVLSKWFRADAVEDADPVRTVALRDAGARRLLTPEELNRKTAAIAGYQWGRQPRINRGAELGTRTRLTDEYRLLYGGIDSDGITERARDITSVMAGVAKRHAVQVSCPVVMRDFFLLPEAKRTLFGGIDQYVTPGSEINEVFGIEADSWSEREAISVRGPLTAGPKTVRFAFTHDHYERPNVDRDIFLVRLDVRNSAGELVVRRNLNEIEPTGEGVGTNPEGFVLWVGGAAMELPLTIPSPDTYELEVVAWANHAGEGLPMLNVVVEAADGSAAGSVAIRNKLVELYDKLLGVQVTPHSPDVEAVYRLFVNTMERRRAAGKIRFEHGRCNIEYDLLFFDGILDGAVVENEQDDGFRWYWFDWDRVSRFMGGIDFSDPHQTVQAWVVVLAYLMTDYRYLYL